MSVSLRSVQASLAGALGLFSLLVLPSLAAAAGDGDQRLIALYEREWLWQREQDAKVRDDRGQWVDADHLPAVDPKTQARRLERWESTLVELDDIGHADLSAEGRINADVFRQILEARVSRGRYRTFEAPINSDTFFWTRLHPPDRRLRGPRCLRAVPGPPRRHTPLLSGARSQHACGPRARIHAAAYHPGRSREVDRGLPRR